MPRRVNVTTSIVSTILLVFSFSGKFHAQSDTIAPQNIDLGASLSKMIRFHERLEPGLEAAAEKYGSALEFLDLARDTATASRDAERFLREAHARFLEGRLPAETAMTTYDSLFVYFDRLVTAILTRKGNFPQSGKTGKMQRIYEQAKARRDTVAGRGTRVRGRLIKAGLIAPPPPVDEIRAGDTATIRRYFTTALSSEKLPSTLGEVQARVLEGGGMRISIGFYKSQPRFDLSEPSLADIRSLVDEFSGVITHLTAAGARLNALEFSAYLRTSEENLAYLPAVVEYTGEFSPMKELDYSFYLNGRKSSRERRTLPIKEGAQGFFNATVLKLEGIRRAFVDNGFDRAISGLHVYAPVEQNVRERFVIGVVLY